MTKMQKLMKENGFEEVGTGGNCTAYRKEVADDGYILITKCYDPTIPTKMNEKIALGLYDSNGDMVDEMEFDNIKNYFDNPLKIVTAQLTHLLSTASKNNIIEEKYIARGYNTLSLGNSKDIRLERITFHPDTPNSYACYQLQYGDWEIWINARSEDIVSMGRLTNRSSGVRDED